MAWSRLYSNVERTTRTASLKGLHGKGSFALTKISHLALSHYNGVINCELPSHAQHAEGRLEKIIKTDQPVNVLILAGSRGQGG